MTILELEKRINLLDLAREKGYPVRRAGTGIYRINPCPICGHQGHFTIYEKNNSYCSFSGCCVGGRAYKFLKEVCGLNDDEAYSELCRLSGENPNIARNKSEKNENQRNLIKPANSTTGNINTGKAKNARNDGPVEKSSTNPKPSPRKTYTEQIESLYRKQNRDEWKYFFERGMTEEIIEKFKLCIVEKSGRKNAVLPIWEGQDVVAYSKRCIGKSEGPKYLNSLGEITLFNGDYLDEKKGQQESENEFSEDTDFLIVTEGIFDALSLEVIGQKAIALGGVNQIPKLIRRLKETKENRYIILTAFDNDDAGKNAHENLEKFQKNIKKIKIPEKYKDINSWLIADKNDFKQSINRQIGAMKNPRNAEKFLLEDFKIHLSEALENQKNKTSFYNLDSELGGIWPGLYVVGGVSSLGKTTFVHQLGDQMAKNGRDVIFFSQEQSTFELVSKSLARQTFLLDRKNALSSFDIRTGQLNKRVEKATEKFLEFARRMHIVDGNFDLDIAFIENFVKRFIKTNKVKPVVIIDYLQILPGKNNSSDKQKTDENIFALKRLSRTLNLTIFVVSSINRGNYTNCIDFESFKESGGIEYTADVVLGIQWSLVTREDFEEKNITKKRALINEEKISYPRNIVVSCLKNRHGKAHFNCFFDYYSKYDTFEAVPYYCL